MQGRVRGVAGEILTTVAKSVLLTWEEIESGASLDLTSDKTRQNPYRVYEQLRRHDPIHRMRLINGWALTKYEDAQEVLQNHKKFSSGDNKLEHAPYRTILDMDPPDHTRLRSLISKAFTPRAVSTLTPRIQQIVNELLDAFPEKKRIDLIKEFAFPLPVIVIAEMLGIPPHDRDQFNIWSNDIALAVEPVLGSKEVSRIQKSSRELTQYFENIIGLRRRNPRRDLLSGLLMAEDEGDRLSHDELIGTLMLLLVAGNETTRSLIGNGMLALLKNQDQLHELRQYPDLLDNAIHELLRYDSPVQIIIRVVAEDVTFKSKRFRAGQKIILLVGAANRDPQVFTDPDKLDIRRTEKSHLSFGRGIHYCLGAPLALLEARIAFSELLKRFPAIDLLAEPSFRNQVVLRGVEKLWVWVDR